MPYQYNEVEPRGINASSYEPEIESWLKGTAGEIDCFEDAMFGPSEHLALAPRESENYDEVFWVVNENGIEEEEPMLYGLSDDDLDYLTIFTPEEDDELITRLSLN